MFIALNLVLQQARILVISTYGVRMPVREIKHDFTFIQFCQKKRGGLTRCSFHSAVNKAVLLSRAIHNNYAFCCKTWRHLPVNNTNNPHKTSSGGPPIRSQIRVLSFIFHFP